MCLHIVHIKQYIVALKKERKKEGGKGEREDVEWERGTHKRRELALYLKERVRITICGEENSLGYSLF